MSAPLPAFIDPTGGAGWPSWRVLQERLVALVPTGYKTGVPKYGAKPDPATGAIPLVDEADFDMYVFDGPWPLLYGEKADGSRPATHSVAGPARFTGCSAQHTNIVRSLRRGWDGQRATATILGVIRRSTIGSEQSKPWNIETLEDGDPRRNLAAQILGAVQGGTMAWAEPVELAAAAPVNPAYYAQPAQQPVAAAAPAWMQPAAPANVAAFVPPAPAQPAAAPMWTPPVPQLVNPGNVDPALWETLSVEHKQMAIAAAQAQAAPAAAPPNPWGAQ